MNGPDFIIIGAMKSGTSTLAEQLGRQDGVFISTPKEPNYFSDDESFAKGPHWYDALFALAQAGDVKGEASTHYTKMPILPGTVSRMKDHCPDLRLIYMIRNPVDRAISHYIHEWSERRMSGDISKALEQSSELVDFGRYSYQLQPYIDAYGKDAIHLTSLEQIKTDPIAEFARIARFLDLPEGAAWIDDLDASNVSANRIRTFPLRKILIDNPIMRPLRQLLIPKSFRLWVWEQLTIKKRPELPADTAKRLEQVFLEDRASLACMFPDHPALVLCYPFAQS